MLAVVLSMTPGVRLKRLPAIISVSALTLNTIRMTLNAIYFTSSWLNLYTVITGDTRPVLKTDYDLSATTTALSIPITILIEAALFVQAWSMFQLWKTVYKAAAVAISLALVFTTIAFNFSVTVIQTLWILYSTNFPFAIWMRQTYVGLITASICWFCFLFNIRLVMHMWQNRTILPSLKGLKAMDVLVITNGILMFVPGMSSLPQAMP
jgi:pheromone alpha factor receptor